MNYYLCSQNIEISFLILELSKQMPSEVEAFMTKSTKLCLNSITIDLLPNGIICISFYFSLI